MLEPRRSDIPALFIFLVVLPVVAYIILGKWCEASKKKVRISLIAQCATVEAHRDEMAAAALIHPLPCPLETVTHPDYVKNAICDSLNNGVHFCGLCFSPATTRCSRCKSVRYCSGKCQIIHWRQSHKQECQLLENSGSNPSSPIPVSVEDFVHESLLTPEDMNSQSLRHPVKQTAQDKSGFENKKTVEKRTAHKSSKEMSRRENGAIGMCDSFEEACSASSCSDNNIISKESFTRPKKRSGKSKLSEGNLHTVSKSSAHGSKLQCQSESINNTGIPISLNIGENGKSSCVFDRAGLGCSERSYCETPRLHCPANIISNKIVVKSKSASKLERTILKASREQLCSEMEGKEQMTELIALSDSIPNHSQEINGRKSLGVMKLIGLKKSKPEKIKMLFPYEEFVQLFYREVCVLSPIGLQNCGNSCYANAVLQCLTFTRPLVIYLLQRSHSRACYVKNWCLMCELEQHLMTMKENGAPMSPDRILSHLSGINFQIGDGSQEDAHEFLRLLVTSMQCICLEGLGGEHVVDPRLQETTFIQHTFGGCLRSKVKCLGCQHESEMYENIMDITLEILGRVESLEDALRQFTIPEDLDGENKYRCGRCAAYVRACKQLTVHVAPNVLTIVLKRFQEGKYGKINKCISFPEMLDMIPYMTGGTGDLPPLYILYAVVVHLDTLNASFSGHYVAYVKDLQGNWFRIDDAQVQPVPKLQVMSEGAYILFYMRSSPRPPRTRNGKKKPKPPSSRHPAPNSPPSDPYPQGPTRIRTPKKDTDPNASPVMTQTYGHRKFSDDPFLFTSSDDASERTRDSFRAVDYGDANMDAASSSSIFNVTYPISCRMFSNYMSRTGFVSEESGRVLDSEDWRWRLGSEGDCCRDYCWDLRDGSCNY